MIISAGAVAFALLLGTFIFLVPPRSRLWQKFRSETAPALDVRYICSYNVHVGGEPLSTGLVFDIVYRTKANARAKRASEGIGARPAGKSLRTRN